MAHAGKTHADGCCRQLGRERVTDVRHQFTGRLLSAAPAGISRHTPAPDKQLPQNDLNHTHTQARTTCIIHTHTEEYIHACLKGTNTNIGTLLQAVQN